MQTYSFETEIGMGVHRMCQVFYQCFSLLYIEVHRHSSLLHDGEHRFALAHVESFQAVQYNYLSQTGVREGD